MKQVTVVFDGVTHDKERKVLEAALPALQQAAEFSSQGDWEAEWKSLSKARKLAETVASFRGPGWIALAISRLEGEGLIFQNSTFLGQVFPQAKMTTLGKTQSFGSIEGPELGIHVRTDRVISYGKIFPIDEFTTASVFVEGTQQITQRPTLARMALLAPLPGSALIAGMATQKKTTEDLREVTFSIASADWQFVENLSPDAIPHAKSIAERVNAIAAKLGASSKEQASQPTTIGVADELLKLKALLDQGLLSPAEFEGAKNRLLG